MKVWRTRSWIDHACRCCGARLCAYEENGETVYECGTCDKQVKGVPEELCGCGVHLNAWLRLSPNRREKEPRPRLPATGPRYQCSVSPSPSERDPAVIVIIYAPAPAVLPK